MYRKQKRMAKVKTLPQKQGVGIQSQFVQKISSLPVVNIAWGYASHKYENILKESNSLVNYTLITAVKSVNYVAEQAKPVIMRFEKQIQAVDDFACKGLGTLEEKAPIITRSPEQIIDETKKLCAFSVQNGLGKLCFSPVQIGLDKYAELKSFGIQKMKDVADYGYQKATDFITSPYGQLLSTSIDGALTLTENYVDYYLPPVGNEGEQNHIGGANDQPVIKRVSNLSHKMRQRMYRHAALQLHNVQKRSQESILKLNYTVDLIQYAKEHMDFTNHKLRETVGTMQRRVSWLWEELNKEEPLHQHSEKVNMEQQLLATARHLTKQLVRTYTTTTNTFQTLPKNIQEGIILAHNYSLELYNQFTVAVYLGDITASILDQVRERIRGLEGTVSSLANNVHVYTIGWLVSGNEDSHLSLEMRNLNSDSDSDLSHQSL